jgi:hypothetical protein
MSFCEKDYATYVVLSGPRTTTPWNWSLWMEIQKSLEPFSLVSRGKAAIRSTQITRNKGKQIPFGRLGWDQKSHLKWTHGAPGAEIDFEELCFLNMEAWAPSWTICVKEGMAPDFYFSLHNEHSRGENEKSLFGSILVAALATSEGSERLAQFEAAVKGIATKLHSPLSLYKHRKWGTPIGNEAFTNALCDLGLIGLFKVGPRHQRPLDSSTFAEHWNTLDIEKA